MRLFMFAIAVAGFGLSPMAMAGGACGGDGTSPGKKKGDSSLGQMGEGCGGCCPGKKGDDKK